MVNMAVGRELCKVNTEVCSNIGSTAIHSVKAFNNKTSKILNSKCSKFDTNHSKDKFSATGKTYHFCQIVGHSASICCSKKGKRQLNNQSASFPFPNRT